MPELILLLPFFVILTFMSHYFAQRIKNSLEVFHFPPVWRLLKITARKHVTKSSWRLIGLTLKLVIITLLALSLAQPTILTTSEISQLVEIPIVEEKDIVGGVLFAIDISPSMGAVDLKPSRLEAAKSLLAELMRNSSELVKFGFVTFDFYPRNVTLLTSDKESLVSLLNNIYASESLACLEENTDIGFGLQTAVDLLSPFTSHNSSCAIVLISDGFANFGYPDPFASVSIAADEAAGRNIEVYTIHTAKLGMNSNPELLELIASKTGGKSMEATSAAELEEVIDTLTKYYLPTNTRSSNIEVKTTIPERMELGYIPLLAATLVIILLWIGNYKHYKTSF
jgi:Ca-activated chloride channel family protein